MSRSNAVAPIPVFIPALFAPHRLGSRSIWCATLSVSGKPAQRGISWPGRPGADACLEL